MISDIFFFWTAAAITVPLVDGAIFGLVVARLRPNATIYASVFLVTLLFFFWIVPFVVYRLATPGLFVEGLHTLGGYLQSFLFVASMGATMAVVRRLQHKE